MNLFRIVGLAARAWMFAARGAVVGRVCEPFLFVTICHLVLLIVLGTFHVPALAPIFEPVVRTLGGEDAVHYPQHFWTLPEVFRSASLVVTLLISPFAFAVATARFAGRPGPWSEARRRAGALLSVAVLGPGLAWGITSLFDLVPEKVALRGFVIRMGLQGIELGLIILLYGSLAYALCFLALGGLPLGPALRRSLGLARLLPLPTLLLVAAPLGILFPLNFFLLEMDLSETGLAPESVGLIIVCRVVLQMILSLLAIGSLTYVYLRIVGDAK